MGPHSSARYLVSVKSYSICWQFVLRRRWELWLGLNCLLRKTAVEVVRAHLNLIVLSALFRNSKGLQRPPSRPEHHEHKTCDTDSDLSLC